MGLTQRVFLVSRKGAEEQRFLFLLYEKGGRVILEGAEAGAMGRYEEM